MDNRYFAINGKGYDMSIQVEKGIPVPPRTGGGDTTKKYPLSDLEVGDSFFVEGSYEKTKSAQVRASQYGAAHGLKFTTRSVAENGVLGMRIWRVE